MSSNTQSLLKKDWNCARSQLHTAQKQVAGLQSVTDQDAIKAAMQLAAVKSDCSLLWRLYIACQSRDGDLDQFFSHENQAAPPALSTGGNLRLAVKADLPHCLKSDQTETTSPLVIDATILDGAAIVQMLNPVAAKTFQEYVNIIFAPYISTQLQKVHKTGLRLECIST